MSGEGKSITVYPKGSEPDFLRKALLEDDDLDALASGRWYLVSRDKKQIESFGFKKVRKTSTRKDRSPIFYAVILQRYDFVVDTR